MSRGREGRREARASVILFGTRLGPSVKRYFCASFTVIVIFLSFHRSNCNPVRMDPLGK